ncbi:MAG: DUF5916 domain-containing protein [Candidatus Eisenbacteria bacterium]
MRLHSLLITALALGGAVASWAAERPSVPATRITGLLRIDGSLDDAAWQTAPAIHAFLLTEAREGQTPSESTIVKVLFDDTRIVFGLWCSARRPLRASLTPRDQITDGDHVSIHLDTDGDGQRAYIFGVNPYGVQLDGILTGDPDFKWDAVWQAEAKRGEGAWTAEIEVPYRAMRLPQHASRPWRLWVRRESAAWNEVPTWPIYISGQAGGVMLQAADITGLGNVHGGRDLTLEPYVFGGLLGARTYGPGGGAMRWFRDQSDDAGVDLQTSITSSLALNATVNPDFSQLEADKLQIGANRRFPLSYPEKRPFFLEGGEVFQSPLNLVYSRRMSDPDWGLKVTGRIRGIRTGALLVRDAGGSSLAGAGAGPYDISRRGSWALTRGTLPYGNGQDVGVLVAGHIQEPDDLSSRTDRPQNSVFALDANGRFSNRWSYQTQLAHTESRFDVNDTLGGRRRESMRGAMGVTRLNYNSRRLEVGFGYRYVDTGYRNEIGFEDRSGVNYKRISGQINHYPKAGPLQRLSYTQKAVVVHDHTGRLDFYEITPGIDWGFRNNQFVWTGMQFIREHWLSRDYDEPRFHVFYENTVWRAVSFEGDFDWGKGIYFGDDDASSFPIWQESYDLSATVRPTSWITVESNAKHLTLARERGDTPLLDLWLVGAKTTAQFTRHLFVRLYPQYDSGSRHVVLNALGGYILHPGTVLYVGVNSGWDEVQSREKLTTRQVFAKASYRFQL